ncbi:hypothetical protein BVY03_01475 [bacterium K02(2017)]|nr:hypothetical protein BVY03_01475 [bacterium K02(2017)]
MLTIDQMLNKAALPDQAQNDFDCFVKDHKITINQNTECLNFFKIFGNSNFLTRFAFNHPEIYNSYQKSDYQKSEKSFDQIKIEISNCTQDATDRIVALKKYKYQEFYRLTIKELLGHDQIQIYRELSHLAKATLETVMLFHFDSLLKKYNLNKEQTGDFTIMLMGKLGGNELNYSSDIDLIGIYENENRFKNITSHELFIKLFSLLSQSLSKTDQHGFLYRVDWDLRPEGKAGTLANSFQSMEYYYQTFGEEWERQAFIKAKPLRPQTKLAKQLNDFFTPFVYRKNFDEKTIKNIWDMKSKIVDALNQKNTDGIHIKLDEGGIRDIEFFAQGFQLLYGGKQPKLRSPNTLTTLNEIQAANLVKPQKIQALCQSYLFLRRLESCIQMEEEQQSHTINDNPEHKFKLARRMGIISPKAEAVAALDEKLYNIRHAVKTIFAQFYK